MKLNISIHNPKTYKTLDIDLPAEYSEIEDVLFRLNCDEIIVARGRTQDEYGRNINGINFENCNIFELNHLATILEPLDFHDTGKFIGAYHILGEDSMTVGKALNLVLNIKDNENVEMYPAQDEKDLAEFYLENDLIPEVKELRDEQYQWILDHTDYTALGEEICKTQKGTFIGGGYVAITDELKDLYDSSFKMPLKEEYAFKFEIGLKNESADSTRITMVFPTSHVAIEEMTNDFEVMDLNLLNCYNFKSSIPMLEPMDFNMEDIYVLNQLATSIKYFEETGTLNTFKALIDALPTIDLETVNEITDYVSEFTLKEDVRNIADYGRSKFQNVLPDELLECLDTTEYGRKLLEKHGADITEYGVLIPNDGVSFIQKIEKAEQMKSTPTLQIGGIS